MAATDVLPSSPGPWSATANLSFDDFLDFPSPLPTPRMSNATVPVQPQRTVATTPAPAPVVAAPPTTANNATAPPPPGSTPEVLFRYYLAAELRRIGSSADDSIIDKYVAQHYASLSKVKTTAAPTAPSVPSTSALPAAPAYAPYRPPSPVHFSPAQAFKVTPEPSALSAPVSIDPHLVELQQSGVRNATIKQSFAAVPYAKTAAPAVKAVPRSSSTDAMSEDEASQHSDGSEDDDEEDSKGTARGGVKQRSVSSSASANDAGHHRHTGISAAAMLRPSPEEYKKLSSKEKRQLRNKISARNFRTRRKEHITQLEEQLADRDAIIDGLRAQLANVNLQNEALKDEVKTLKTKTLSQTDVSRILEALQRTTSGSALALATAPPTEPTLNRTSSSSSLNFLNMDVTMSSGSRPSTPSSPRPSIVRRSTPTLATPNTRKDVGAGSGASFWGGAGGTNALVSAA